MLACLRPGLAEPGGGRRDHTVGLITMLSLSTAYNFSKAAGGRCCAASTMPAYS